MIPGQRSPSLSAASKQLLSGLDVSACFEEPLETGKCSRRPVAAFAITAWSFVAANSSCVQFDYSGCGTSANVFLSQEECASKCAYV